MSIPILRDCCQHLIVLKWPKSITIKTYPLETWMRSKYPVNSLASAAEIADFCAKDFNFNLHVLSQVTQNAKIYVSLINVSINRTMK